MEALVALIVSAMLLGFIVFLFLFFCHLFQDDTNVKYYIEDHYPESQEPEEQIKQVVQSLSTHN